MAKKKALSARAKKRIAKMRRDPFGRLSLEIGRYLETVGWRAILVGTPQVHGYKPSEKFGHFEFCVKFTGGRIAARAEQPTGDTNGTERERHRENSSRDRAPEEISRERGAPKSVRQRRKPPQ